MEFLNVEEIFFMQQFEKLNLFSIICVDAMKKCQISDCNWFAIFFLLFFHLPEVSISVKQKLDSLGIKPSA